jgi:hypothetical protein
VAGNGSTNRPYSESLAVVTALRECGFSVAHGMNEEKYKSQATRNQVDAAKKAGAMSVVYFREDGVVEAMSLLGKMKDAATVVIDVKALQSPLKKTRKEAKKAIKKWLGKQRERAADAGSTDNDNG